MDIQLRIATAIICVLSRGPHDGNALHQGVTDLCGYQPEYGTWRNALIQLLHAKQIEKEEVRDDDEILTEVIYKLPKGKTTTGADNGQSKNV